MLISIPERITRLQNLFLNSITAVLLIDSDGNRLLSKYYQPAHADPKAATTPFKNPFQSLKDQRAFEQAIWEKTRRANGTRYSLVPHCQSSESMCTASKPACMAISAWEDSS